MIKIYDFDFKDGEASASFEVNTSLFTDDMALATLEFYSWDYENDFDDSHTPVDEVMKKYALESIRSATFNSFNLHGVIRDFEGRDGFAKIDGSSGIKLLSVKRFEFDEEDLDVAVKDLSNK